MTPERWEQLAEIWSSALDREPVERERYLDEVCAGDQTLRDELGALLTADAGAETEGFLAVPPWALDEVPLELPDFGDYSEVEYLGHGGMGVVYRAFQRSLSRPVALKVSHTAVLSDSSDERRFRAEAENMARLRHPHIVHVYEVGSYGDRPYFCMELIEGTHLGQHLKELRQRPREAARLVRTVAEAVHHAHEAGVLHRDLKPANILLDDNGEPHVTDFGLARRIDHGESVEQATRGLDPDGSAWLGIAGTAAFMAPEQLDGNETALGDVFGLGAVLYALLTGRGPHQGRDFAESLANLHGGVTPPVLTVNPEVPEDLAAICTKALARDPAGRHPSARALAEDLDRWLHGRETSARPWSFVRRVQGYRERNPLLAMSIAVTVVLVVAVGLLLGLRLHEGSLEQERVLQGLARERAGTLGLRIEQLSDVVGRTAADPTLATSIIEADGSRLGEFIATVGSERVDLGGDSPYASWFVMDLEGHIIARWPELPRDVEGVTLAHRAHFVEARRAADSEPRVTGVYRAVTDDSFKFGISAAVTGEDGILGVVAASVPTSATLGLPPLDHGDGYTAVIADLDPSSTSENPGLADCRWIVLLHPTYERGEQPVCAPWNEAMASGGVVHDYEDPVAAIDPEFAGPWLAAFEPIAQTGFVVVVQRRP